ncbi:MAG: TrkA C-terminal domain-containing protein [bacterium]|nr:TrkA C-terminal domain-containing protein [Bacillota bacterium]
MAHRKKLADFSRYEQIALDLALRIIRDEYQIGERVSGRSTLAGRYKVSPETIRRAVALLEDAGVVETIAGTGIVIKSKKAAEDYFQAFEGEKAMANLQKKLNQLMETRRRLDQEVEQTVQQMVSYLWGMINNLQYLEKIEIPADSWMVGKDLAETKLRSRTGATVVSIERDGEEIYSPSSKMEFKAGDRLSVVGTMQAKGMVRELVAQKVLEEE